MCEPYATYQHNVEAADGLEGFGAAAGKWASAGKNLVYTTIHKVIADGEFVFVRSAGDFGIPISRNDVCRVEEGKIVEH